MLYNRYQAGAQHDQQLRTSAPYAYIIPQEQRDPVAPVELLRRLAFMGIRIKQLDRDATYDGTTYPKGTWVIPMDQEYAQLVRELFEPQKYPDLGDDTPYDAAGWTLPFQMGVNVIEAATPLRPSSAPRSSRFRRARRSTGARRPTRRSRRTPPRPASCRAPGEIQRNRRSAAARSRTEQLVHADRRALSPPARRVASQPRREWRGVGTSSPVSRRPRLDAWAKELWVTGERTVWRSRRDRRLRIAAAQSVSATKDGPSGCSTRTT